MVRRLLPPILGLLAACASAPPSVPPAEPVAVQMPIYAPVYCEPPALIHPALPIAALTAQSAAADTMRAYAATVEILKGAVDDRDAVIAGCASPAGNAPQAPVPGGSAPTVPTASVETSQPAANAASARSGANTTSQVTIGTAGPKATPGRLTTRVINAARAIAGFTFGE